jgi:hypothetical protein
MQIKITEEKKQNSNLSIRINKRDREAFKRKCREKDRDYSEVLRSLISMVNNETIVLEKK